MKKYLVASMLACTALCSSAFAADGVINVTGKIIDNACLVSPTLDVRLGTRLRLILNTWEIGVMQQRSSWS